MPTSPRVGGLTPVPPPPPPPQSAARQGSVRVRVESEWKWRLRLEMAGVLSSAAFQVVYLLRQWGTSSLYDNVHMLLVVAYHFLILSTMLGREPTLYRRYRVWIYAVMRPLGYLSPSVRSTKAAASVLLSISATPGAWGAVMDLKRVMLASRITGTAVIGVVQLVPPVVCLFVQIVCTYLAANNSGYCATQLLSDPVSRQRTSRLAGALDLASLPFSAVVLMPPDDAHEVRQCEALLAFLQLLVAVLLPMVVLARTEWEEPALTAMRAEEPAVGLQTRLMQMMRHTGERLNWVVWRACALPASAHFLLTAWLLLALSWTACLVAYGL